MARTVRLVVVCEDILHEAFARRLLGEYGHDKREIQIVRPPPQSGDAKEAVASLMTQELRAWRQFKRPSRGILVMVDADQLTVEQRRRWLEVQVSREGLEPPSAEEPVFVFVPKWEIENWLAYLGGVAVGEEINTYDKFRGRESDTRPLARRLAESCKSDRLIDPPDSLRIACGEFQRFLRWRR